MDAGGSGANLFKLFSALLMLLQNKLDRFALEYVGRIIPEWGILLNPLNENVTNVRLRQTFQEP